VNFILSRHARKEIERRGIPLALVEAVLEDPQEIVSERGGKRAYQSQLDFGSGKVFLLRVIVDDTADPPTVITVYRTSKIDKYRGKA
jgi:hypothetical protein